jgi:hypothetical protein
MSKSIMILMVMLLVSCASPKRKGGKLKVKYNKTFHVTVVSVSTSIQTTKGHLSVDIFGDKENSSSINLVFESYNTLSDGWGFLGCSYMDLNADNKSIPLDGFRYSGDVTENGIHERVTARMSREYLPSIANATKIGGSVCGGVFDLYPAQVAKLKEFVVQLGSPPTTQSAN